MMLVVLLLVGCADVCTDGCGIGMYIDVGSVDARIEVDIYGDDCCPDVCDALMYVVRLVGLGSAVVLGVAWKFAERGEAGWPAGWLAGPPRRAKMRKIHNFAHFR